MMDVEDGLVAESKQAPEISPVMICKKIPCCVSSGSLQDIFRVAMIMASVQFVVTTVVYYMRPPLSMVADFHELPTGHVDIRLCALVLSLILLVQYAVYYFNILSKGWGDADSPFWCDVRIMYVRGFNTIRTMTRFFTSSLLACLLLVVEHAAEYMTIVFAIVIVILFEWQHGLSQLKNQYDVRLEDKFINSDNQITIHLIQSHQEQQVREKISWVSFIMANILKCVLCVMLWVYVYRLDTALVFWAPLLVLFTAYVWILPTLWTGLYLTNRFTFVDTEIHEMLCDALCVPLIIICILV